MKIKVTFKTGNSAYIKEIIKEDEYDDWEYAEYNEASNFGNETECCFFLRFIVSDLYTSFFNDDNIVTKIEFVE